MKTPEQIIDQIKRCSLAHTRLRVACTIAFCRNYIHHDRRTRENARLSKRYRKMIAAAKRLMEKAK